MTTWQGASSVNTTRHGFVTVQGGTGTLVELAVVWEMLNKGVMKDKPFIVLGNFGRRSSICAREVKPATAA